MALTHALVLAAGLGTRLRPLTLVRAKPAIPVAGDPLIRRIVRGLRAHGVEDVVVNLHHLPASVASVLGDGADLGVRVRYSWEQPVVLGSAGGPRLARAIVGARRFLVVNGDTLTDVDVSALAAAHERSGALVTLALTPHRDARRYGGVVLDQASRVTGFVRKGEGPDTARHFVGVQVVEAAAFDDVPLDVPTNSVGGLYDRLMARDAGSVRGHVASASFWDIGTVADYLDASRALAPPGGVPAGKGSRVDATARVTRSILWDDVVVGPGATLDGCVVTDGVQVAAGAAHADVILRADPALGVIATPLEHARV